MSEAAWMSSQSALRIVDATSVTDTFKHSGKEEVDISVRRCSLGVKSNNDWGSRLRKDPEVELVTSTARLRLVPMTTRVRPRS